MELLLELEEAEELRMLLGQALADLSYEIADTDSWEYRRQLRERRERLERIERRLAGEGCNASRLPQGQKTVPAHGE